MRANAANSWESLLENQNVENLEATSRAIQEAGAHQPVDITALD